MGYRGAVKSPTFTLVESYTPVVISADDNKPSRRGLHHFDLYRVADPDELDFIGFEEYLDDDFDVLIEWPERGGDRITDGDFGLAFQHHEAQRRVTLIAHSTAAQKLAESSSKRE